MYSQRNHSESLLTQPFHPPAEEQLVDHAFLQDQLQQQSQYNQEQLEDIPFNASQLMLSSNAFALQSLDGSMPQSTLPAEWPLYSDALTGMTNNISVYDGGDLMTDNPMMNDPSWQLISAGQQPSQLADSPPQSQPTFPNTAVVAPDQLPRAQTPGPQHRMNAPHYLHMRRRSLSADNIHALAKQHQAATQRKAAFAQQQSASQFERPQFTRSQTLVETVENEDELQHNIKLEQAAFQQVSGNMIIDSHTASNDDCQSSVNEQQQPSSLQTLSSNSSHSSNPSTPDSEQAKHAQKQSEFTARFKIRLDRKPQRMPNLHVAATSASILSAAQSKMAMMPGVIGALPGGMELASSMSTPNTPTFTPDNGSNVDNKPSAPPRRGHTRKRSLSAPQAFQGQQNNVNVANVPPFPYNVSPTPRRINALPIQISRNHKHSYNSTPMSSEEYQRKLDEELVKVDFEDITVSELKDMLRQRGKPATGKKAVLMQRLQEEMAHLKAKQNQQQQNKQACQNQQNQQNQNQQPAVKPKPQQLGSTGNINQFPQMLSSPTSPSGISLQHSLGNLHISSPTVHSQRYSPYTTSVSIPNSPRMLPNRASAGFNNGTYSFGANEEWAFNNVAVHSPGFMGQSTTPMDDPTAVYMLMMENQQTSPQQDYFGPQEPSSAPATTTEFDTYQAPSSAPATTTEFEGFQQSPQSVNPVYMNMDVPMGMIGVNFSGDMTGQDADQSSATTNAMNGVVTSQQGLGFAYGQQQAMVMKPESWNWQ